ncbi:MAG: hypothetical protein B7X08_02385, partial [Acidocella sp. 20-63-7]
MPLNLGEHPILRADVIILSVALVILLVGIGILVKDLLARDRSSEVSEEPIDLTRFAQPLKANEAPFLPPEPPAEAQPADDLFVFRRDLHASPADIRSLEEILRKPKKPFAPDPYDSAATVPSIDLDQDIDSIGFEARMSEPEILVPESASSRAAESAILHYFLQDTPAEEDAALEFTQTIESRSAVDEHQTTSVAKPAQAPADIPSVILACDGYGVGFGGKVILADVAFEVPANGITTLTGPSGTGKSTFLRSLAGLYAQNTLYKSWGQVRYRDEVLSIENRPAIVIQRIQLTQSLTLDNLAFHVKDRDGYTENQL